tara:strand:- start:605 stop:1087 length:483 start_codon:yes stop_codon:yes gene_type:complete
MSLLGNIIWLITGGLVIGLGYLIFAIIFFPLLPFLWPLVKYSFAPFGKGVVRRSDLNKYKKREDYDSVGGIDNASTVVRFLANTLWVLTAGIIMAFAHLLAGLVQLAACIFIITIPLSLPNALANFRMIGPAFRPFGLVIVPKALAEEIKVGAAKQSLGI